MSLNVRSALWSSAGGVAAGSGSDADSETRLPRLCRMAHDSMELEQAVAVHTGKAPWMMLKVEGVDMPDIGT